MKVLGSLIRIIKIFGWLSIIVGAMALFAAITTPVGLNLRSISTVALSLFGGIVYLAIASGLSKRKKWAWYTGVVVFIYVIIHNFLLGSMANIVAGFIVLAFLITLFVVKKTIFEQTAEPPKNISQT
ncbi:MAG: hypothetical protein HYT36_01005 [Candidatus Staskawiczbacteria bacterium]|nr:hypothetical protein [Candidatus Staskawiczbacteria bacterium]